MKRGMGLQRQFAYAYSPWAAVLWDGVPLPTIYLSELEVQVQLTSKQLDTGREVSVVVFNPGPGGGGSLSVPFTIEGWGALHLPVIIKP